MRSSYEAALIWILPLLSLVLVFRISLLRSLPSEDTLGPKELVLAEIELLSISIDKEFPGAASLLNNVTLLQSSNRPSFVSAIHRHLTKSSNSKHITVAIMGTSCTAGHDNHYNQTFSFQ